MSLKPLCKLCPQLAVCMVDGRFGGALNRCFYPRSIENSDHIVFECYAPHPTGEKRPSNGGDDIDVFRIKKPEGFPV
jgi:hypothetical protein